jgi:hypothetical protein
MPTHAGGGRLPGGCPPGATPALFTDLLLPQAARNDGPPILARTLRAAAGCQAVVHPCQGV